MRSKRRQCGFNGFKGDEAKGALQIPSQLQQAILRILSSIGTMQILSQLQIRRQVHVFASKV